MDRRLMPCARRDERGFTLIEIILVLLLMALMAGLVVQWSPKLKAPDATTEHEKALMIARIAHARNQAVLRNQEVTLEVNGGTSLYYKDMTPLTGEGSKENDGYAVTFEKVKLTSSKGDSFTMTFDEDFNYSGPDTVTITHTDDAQKTSTLSINGVGYVE